MPTGKFCSLTSFSERSFIGLLASQFGPTLSYTLDNSCHVNVTTFASRGECAFLVLFPYTAAFPINKHIMRSENIGRVTCVPRTSRSFPLFNRPLPFPVCVLTRVITGGETLSLYLWTNLPQTTFPPFVRCQWNTLSLLCLLIAGRRANASGRSNTVRYLVLGHEPIEDGVGRVEDDLSSCDVENSVVLLQIAVREPAASTDIVYV